MIIVYLDSIQMAPKPNQPQYKYIATTNWEKLDSTSFQS